MFGGFSVIPGTLFAEFVKRKIILYYNFSPVTIRDWHSLPKDILSAKLVPSLKKCSNKLTDRRLIPFTLLDMVMKKLSTPDLDLD
jgi:hypothetical protein